MARKNDDSNPVESAPASDLVGGSKEATAQEREPDFILDSDGVKRPNPRYMAAAESTLGKFNPQQIYHFVYIGPTLHKLPAIRDVDVERGGKTVKEWRQTGEDDITLKPGQRVDYLGWIANTDDGDFIVADDSAVNRDWPYPWNEDAIIERFKRVPPELFEEFCEGYFELFGDRRRKVYDFYLKTAKQHRKTIQDRENAAF